MRTFLICAALLAFSIVPLASAATADCDPVTGDHVGVECTMTVDNRESEAGTVVNATYLTGETYYCFDLLPPSRPNIYEPCEHTIWN